MKYQEEIKEHQSKIIQLKDQIKKLYNNYDNTKNVFLSEEINQKILQHEVSQLENEILLHQFCIHCIKENKHLDLTLDSVFNNARKKKLNKLVKKYSYEP